MVLLSFGDYSGVVSKILGDEWVNPQFLSIQSLKAHQRSDVAEEDRAMIREVIKDCPAAGK